MPCDCNVAAFAKAFSALGRPLPKEPVVRPRESVAARSDTIVEYEIFLGGRLGFELLRETANTVGLVHTHCKARVVMAASGVNLTLVPLAWATRFRTSTIPRRILHLIFTRLCRQTS